MRIVGATVARRHMQMNAVRAWPTLGGWGMRKILSAISDEFLIRCLTLESTAQDRFLSMPTQASMIRPEYRICIHTAKARPAGYSLDGGKSNAWCSRDGHGRPPPASAKKPLPVLSPFLVSFDSEVFGRRMPSKSTSWAKFFSQL